MRALAFSLVLAGFGVGAADVAYADRPTPTVHAQHIAIYFCRLGDHPSKTFDGTLAELAVWQQDAERAPVPDLGTPGKRWPNLWLRVVQDTNGNHVCELTWQTDETFEEVIDDLQGFDVTNLTSNGATGVQRSRRVCCDPGEFELIRLEDDLYRLRLFPLRAQ